MQIELYREGEKKVFVAPFVPMLAKRKYLEIQSKREERESELTIKEQIAEDDEYFAILSNIVFNNEFTLADLYTGASKEYLDQKLAEAVFDIKPSDLKKTDSNEGNEAGK